MRLNEQFQPDVHSRPVIVSCLVPPTLPPAPIPLRRPVRHELPGHHGAHAHGEATLGRKGVGQAGADPNEEDHHQGQGDDRIPVGRGGMKRIIITGDLWHKDGGWDSWSVGVLFFFSGWSECRHAEGWMEQPHFDGLEQHGAGPRWKRTT